MCLLFIFSFQPDCLQYDQSPRQNSIWRVGILVASAADTQPQAFTVGWDLKSSILDISLSVASILPHYPASLNLVLWAEFFFFFFLSSSHADKNSLSYLEPRMGALLHTNQDEAIAQLCSRGLLTSAVAHNRRYFNPQQLLLRFQSPQGNWNKPSQGMSSSRKKATIRAVVWSGGFANQVTGRLFWYFLIKSVLLSGLGGL